jgi:uncharacterized sodium:solute symporter family permease YidK
VKLDWREIASRGTMALVALACVLIGLRLARAADSIWEDAEEMAGMLSVTALALLATGLWLVVGAFRPRWKG